MLFSSTFALGGSCTRHTISNFPAGLEVAKYPFTLRVCPDTMTRQGMDIQAMEDWQKEFGRRLVEKLGLQGTICLPCVLLLVFCLRSVFNNLTECNNDVTMYLSYGFFHMFFGNKMYIFLLQKSRV